MSRHRSKKCERDGYKFDSLSERAFYDELCLRKKAGDIKDFEVKPIFEIGIRQYGDFIIHIRKRGQEWKGIWGKTIFTYTPDFVVDGELVDVKGWKTYRTKKRGLIKEKALVERDFALKARILAALGLPIKVVK